MRSFKVILMSALLLALSPVQILWAGEFDSIFKPLTDVGTKVDNALVQARAAFKVGTSTLGGIGSSAYTQAAKTILPSALFGPACVGVGVVDGVKTGITGLNGFVMDFTRSDLGTKLLGPSPLSKVPGVNSLVSAKDLGAPSFSDKISSAKSIEGLGSVTVRRPEIYKPL